MTPADTSPTTRLRYSGGSRTTLVGCALWILAVVVAPADPALAVAETWITVGSDAFDTLERSPLFGDVFDPLIPETERGGIVLTKVPTETLNQISVIIHTTHGRCGGFMVHEDQEAGKKAINQLAFGELKAAPVSYEIRNQTRVIELQNQLQGAQILGTIGTLSNNFQNRYYNEPSGRAAAEWLHSRWRNLARQHPNATTNLFPHSDWLQPSVVLTIPGTTNPNEVVVLGGHLDSITGSHGEPGFRAPGADDNASGIATITEVIRVLTSEGFRPSRTLKFFGYAAEEIGLRGSQEIAASFRNLGSNVVGVMQLDMTAFNGSVEDISLISDFTNADLNDFVGELIDTYQPGLSWSRSACGYACSDHASWLREGFPAAFPFEARVGNHNPQIHTTADTTATFSNNASHALKFGKLAMAFVVELGLSSDSGTPPAAPSGLQAAAVSESSASLTWSDNSNDESGFQVQRQGGGQFETVATTAAGITTWTDEGLVSGSEYSYRVKAINAFGGSPLSNVASVTTLGERAPAFLTAATISATTIRLEWADRATSESGYTIEGHSGGEFQAMASLPADTEAFSLLGLEPLTEYTFRVRATGGLGDSTYSEEVTASTFDSMPDPCVGGPTALCLNGGRFKVEVDWRNYSDVRGEGKVVPQGADDSGLLWFFGEKNWEMLVKVLDGCSGNGHFWVFAAATTDVEYLLTVTDTYTGVRAVYFNPLGRAAPAIADNRAFRTCEVQRSVADPDESPAETAPSQTAPAGPDDKDDGDCASGDDAMCLQQGRFRVSVSWEDFSAQRGAGQVVPVGSEDSGLFWFFDAENWEFLVKVLDGCSANGKYWVYAGATTTVAYTLEVLDTVTGERQTYENSLGNAAAAINDINAFDCSTP